MLLNRKMMRQECVCARRLFVHAQVKSGDQPIRPHGASVCGYLPQRLFQSGSLQIRCVSSTHVSPLSFMLTPHARLACPLTSTDCFCDLLQHVECLGAVPIPASPWPYRHGAILLLPNR